MSEPEVQGQAETAKVGQQRRLYGEPVGSLVRSVTQRLDLTQSQVARLLGLSPAMLSQLVHGQRVKIGNPQALARLQALLALADGAGAMTRDTVEERLAEIGEARATLTTSPVAPTGQGARLIRDVLRSVASGREIDEAARALAEVSPGLAEVVRVYGTGSEDDARAHLESIAHLLRD